MFFIGLIMIIIGVAGILFVQRRKFYRRNVAGVEEFNSFGHSIITGSIEAIIHFASFFLAIIGVIVVLVSFMT
ncbi:MAG: hypothetical protein J6W29_04790 [Neisseriaceae bacterium]|nr:hypothetical protein [Neisseriaceae bacterium]